MSYEFRQNLNLSQVFTLNGALYPNSHSNVNANAKATVYIRGRGVQRDVFVCEDKWRKKRTRHFYRLIEDYFTLFLFRFSVV